MCWVELTYHLCGCPKRDLPAYCPHAQHLADARGNPLDVPSTDAASVHLDPLEQRYVHGTEWIVRQRHDLQTARPWLPAMAKWKMCPEVRDRELQPGEDRQSHIEDMLACDNVGRFSKVRHKPKKGLCPLCITGHNWSGTVPRRDVLDHDVSGSGTGHGGEEEDAEEEPGPVTDEGAVGTTDLMTQP